MDVRDRWRGDVPGLPSLPQPWDLMDFISRVARQRGRPIQLMPVNLSGSLHGLWLGADLADYIVFPQNTSGYQKHAIVLHEIAHMWLGHPSRDIAELAGRINPSPYQQSYEDQANEVAGRILQHAAVQNPPRPAAPDVLRVVETFETDTSAHDLPSGRRHHHPVLRRLHRAFPILRR